MMAAKGGKDTLIAHQASSMVATTKNATMASSIIAHVDRTNPSTRNQTAVVRANL